MKNTIKLFGIIALVAVIGFSMAGCKNDSGPETYTYTGTADGVTYKLEIFATAPRAAIDGDTYKLTVGTKISTGTITVSGTTFTLKASNAEEGITLTITVNSSNGITNIAGTITFEDGSTKAGPGDITPPVTPPTGGGGEKVTGTVRKDHFGNITFELISAVGACKVTTDLASPNNEFTLNKDNKKKVITEPEKDLVAYTITITSGSLGSVTGSGTTEPIEIYLVDY